MKTVNFRNEIETIRLRMAHGEITYEKAQELAKPLIAEMNVRAEKVAKSFGKRKPKPFTFSYLMR